MKRQRRYVACLAMAGLVGIAVGQEKAGLQARELFYQAVDTPGSGQIVKTQAGGRQRPTVTGMPRRTPSDATPSRTTPKVELPSTPRETTAAMTEAPAPPRPHLGLRYAVLQKSANGWEAMDPEKEFRTGDEIRLELQSNSSGYLYLLSKSSSGTWEPLFPLEHEDNRVAAARKIEAPAADADPIVFAGQPGTERLYAVLSREPIAEFERFFPGRPKAEPAPEQPLKQPAPPANTQLAQNRLGDPAAFVDFFRRNSLESRDLVRSKVTKVSHPQIGESAMYVVNMKSDRNARVVAEILLRHK